MDQVPAYREAIAWLHARGYAIVMLPHVDRGAKGDEWAISEVLAGLDETIPVHRLGMLSPAAVRSLTQVADIVISGRMHLAIMSLSNSTLPVVIATQGKVLGLLTLFGLERLSVEPDTSLSRKLLEAIEYLDAHAARLQDTADAALPAVIDLARRNFESVPVLAEGE